MSIVEQVSPSGRSGGAQAAEVVPAVVVPGLQSPGSAVAAPAVAPVPEAPGACAGLDDHAGLKWCWQESSGTAWLFDLSPWLPLPRLLCAPGREAASQAADGRREQGGVSWRGLGSDRALAATRQEEPSSRSHRALAGLICCLQDPSTEYSSL